MDENKRIQLYVFFVGMPPNLPVDMLSMPSPRTEKNERK